MKNSRLDYFLSVFKSRNVCTTFLHPARNHWPGIPGPVSVRSRLDINGSQMYSTGIKQLTSFDLTILLTELIDMILEDVKHYNQKTMITIHCGDCGFKNKPPKYVVRKLINPGRRSDLVYKCKGCNATLNIMRKDGKWIMRWIESSDMKLIEPFRAEDI